MKVENPGSFLDHFIRQTRIHHVQLSGMADMKANMMLTVASVVLTFTVGYLADPAFQWAALTLIIFCFASIVAAIYSAMPRVQLPTKNTPRPDKNDPNYNPLFFGTFIHMTLEEYNDVMEQAVNDPSEAVELMVREIYTLGCFLAYRKYRYLRWAYLLFLSGLLVAGLVQGLCVTLQNLGFETWQFYLTPTSAAMGG